jgi:hypothetical protein
LVSRSEWATGVRKTQARDGQSERSAVTFIVRTYFSPRSRMQCISVADLVGTDRESMSGSQTSLPDNRVRQLSFGQRSRDNPRSTNGYEGVHGFTSRCRNCSPKAARHILQGPDEPQWRAGAATAKAANVTWPTCANTVPLLYTGLRFSN